MVKYFFNNFRVIRVIDSIYEKYFNLKYEAYSSGRVYVVDSGNTRIRAIELLLIVIFIEIFMMCFIKTNIWHLGHLLGGLCEFLYIYFLYNNIITGSGN